MFSVYIMDMIGDEQIHDRDFDTYEDALAYAQNIATKPVYYVPDPDGVYVLIYDENHDGPRYTSW